MMIFPKFKYFVFTTLVFFSVPQVLFAATVLQIDMDYLLDKARLIFEGEVVSNEAKWSSDKTTITTFITFRVKDVIKGNAPASTVTLEFSGGTVGETGLHISSMVYPLVGENGIYFLENPGQRFINPLLGWGQGHFRIKKDGKGTERMLTEGGAPVLGLDVTVMNGADRGNAGTPSFPPFSHGVARGVQAGKSGDALSAAMEKKYFKDTLKARLAVVKTNAQSTHMPEEKQP